MNPATELARAGAGAHGMGVQSPGVGLDQRVKEQTHDSDAAQVHANPAPHAGVSAVKKTGGASGTSNDENAAIHAAVNALPKMPVERPTYPADLGIHPHFQAEKAAVQIRTRPSHGMHSAASRTRRQWVFGVATLLICGAAGFASFYSHYGWPEQLTLNRDAIAGLKPLRSLKPFDASKPSTVDGQAGPQAAVAPTRAGSMSGTGPVLQGSPTPRPASPAPKNMDVAADATRSPASTITPSANRTAPLASAMAATPGPARPTPQTCAPAVAALGLCG